MKNDPKSIAEMIEEMTHYYEAAGFSGIHNRQYEGKNEEDIRRMYRQFQKEYKGFLKGAK